MLVTSFPAALLVFFACVSSVLACPEGCHCYRNRLTWSSTMDCVSRGWREVPSPLASNINEFMLGDNFIQEIPSGSFSEASNAQKVSLSSNMIHHIAHDGFAGLTNLRELSLTANRISDISFLSGEQMPLLIELSLNKNPISEIPPSIFESFSNIRDLYLNEMHLKDLSNARLTGQRISLNWNPLEHIGHAAFARPHEVDSLSFLECSFRNLSYIGNLTALQYITFDKNRIHHIEETFFSSLSSLDTLSLSGNKITDVFPFQDMPILRRLDLSKNDIFNIPGDSFQNLPLLEVLDLRDNRISVYSIPTHVSQSILLNTNHLTEFDGRSLNLSSARIINLINNPNLQSVIITKAANLGSVYMDHCAIQNINITEADNLRLVFAMHNNIRSLASFHDLPEIKYLRLDENLIDSVGTNGLVGLPKLTWLKLSHNRFSTFPVFPDLSSLEQLDLSYNRLEIISVNSLATLPNLETLDLSGNRFQIIPVFPNMPLLEDLFLSENPIISFEQSPFQQLTSLKKVEMIKCNLTSIPSLGAMPSLQQLTLEHNQISEVDFTVLSGIPNLQLLQLSYNEITFLPALMPIPMVTVFNLSHNAISNIDLFAFLLDGSLTSLDISYNMVDSIDFLTYTPSSSLSLRADFNQIQKFPISGIPETVRTMFVKGNQITQLPPFTFIMATRLYTLDLSNNQIRHVPAFSFSQCSYLSSLRLYNNPIESIDEEGFNGLTSLSFLWLDNIPLPSFSENLFESTPNLQHFFATNVPALTEQERPLLLHIPRLRMIYFDNPKLISMPNASSSPDLQTISAVNCNLTYVPNELFIRHPYLKVLRLSHNRISIINEGDFQNAVKLLDLYLDHNRINLIEPGSFKPFLYIIFIGLQSNKLTHFDIGIPYANGIDNIDLSNNPWHCDCRLESLKYALLQFDDADNPIRCVSPPELSTQIITALEVEDLGCMVGNVSSTDDDFVTETVYKLETELDLETGTEIVTEVVEVVEMYTIVFEEGSGIGDDRAVDEEDLGPPYEREDDDNTDDWDGDGGVDDGGDVVDVGSDQDDDQVTIPQTMSVTTRMKESHQKPINGNRPCSLGIPTCSSYTTRAPSIIIIAFIIAVFALKS